MHCTCGCIQRCFRWLVSLRLSAVESPRGLPGCCQECFATRNRGKVHRYSWCRGCSLRRPCFVSAGLFWFALPRPSENKLPRDDSPGVRDLQDVLSGHRRSSGINPSPAETLVLRCLLSCLLLFCVDRSRLGRSRIVAFESQEWSRGITVVFGVVFVMFTPRLSRNKTHGTLSSSARRRHCLRVGFLVSWCMQQRAKTPGNH